ncbi:HDOD domain-containing protein [Pseudoalteromonas ardens]|uniref:HDOD domain-containing protein n=1 Tax=Pseudoalteromonas ardens TaxID=3048490 RepID=UPI0024C28F58|nr:HDOD domain-containing protein [Pseudoalteromonas sp. R96]MDK1311657.1 HDOD domain-containing protein [Pseudoalteromonas sp. R96]
MLNIDEKTLAELRSGFNLPAKPEVLEHIQNELNSEEPELNRVANIISQDVATSAAVLKVINSPAYGMSRTVSDIKQAVMFLGLNSITQIVTGYLLKEAFDQSLCCISLERFWDNAIDISQIAMLIGKRVRANVPIENLQLLGLFHDAGIPAMAMRYDNYKEVMTRAIQRPEYTLANYEEELYPTNHAVVGYYLASSWNIPKSMCQIILRHHDPQYLEEERDESEQQAFAILKLAENLAFEGKYFRNCADWHAFKDKIMIVLNIHDDDYVDIKEDIEEFLISGN